MPKLVPLNARQQAAPSALPRVPPGSKWTYKHHPARFDVHGGAIRPTLAKLKHIPGVNQVTSKGVIGAAKLEDERKGWLILDEVALKDYEFEGQKGFSYLLEWEVRGGTVHVDRWTKLFPGTDRTQCDTEGYYEWLDSLIAQGIIASPSPLVLDSLHDRYQALTDRSRAIGTPGADRRADHFASCLKVVADAIEAAKPKKPKKRAPRKPVLEVQDEA